MKINNIIYLDNQDFNCVNAVINEKNKLENYILSLNENCDKEIKEDMKQHKKTHKKNVEKMEDSPIISFTNYSSLLNNNYNISQLKVIAKHYKLKISGNKNELLSRIYIFLKLSLNILKIQKIFRGYMQRLFNKYHGPALLDRSICTNTTDFLTFENINELPFSQFFSYTDIDGFTYGFNIISLYNLILKSGRGVKNPYNRNEIPSFVITNIKHLIKLSKLLNCQMDLKIQDINLEITNEKSIDLRILDVFQTIDSLGNYSDPAWFLSLNRFQLLKFLRELADIWNYRAQLTIDIKKKICPPIGDPFQNLNSVPLHNEQNIKNIQIFILPILEKLVNSGVDTDSKSLGAYYVLGALTIVNETAASSLPWLFQSFSYF
jgi:hypothetical protein